MASVDALEMDSLLVILVLAAACMAALRLIAMHAQRRVSQRGADAVASAGMNQR
jgi:hypothetical protein